MLPFRSTSLEAGSTCASGGSRSPLYDPSGGSSGPARPVGRPLSPRASCPQACRGVLCVRLDNVRCRSVGHNSEHWRLYKHLSKRTIGRQTDLTQLDLCAPQVRGDQFLRVIRRRSVGPWNNLNPQQAMKNSRVSLAHYTCEVDQNGIWRHDTACQGTLQTSEISRHLVGGLR